MNKIKLAKIDIENRRFVLYETIDGKWIGDFVYSPKSFIDLSILIELTDFEKAMVQNDRQSLIGLSETIRDNYNDYLERALNRNNYLIND